MNLTPQEALQAIIDGKGLECRWRSGFGGLRC